MLVSEVRALTISDIHLGHPKNTTSNIINNLRVFFRQYDGKGLLDILFLAGDVFDSSLSFSDTQVNEFTIWASEVLNFCNKNTIKLRVLDGTPSHDRNQSKTFETIAKITRSPCDLKYINTISIEHMEDFGIDILYIPDIQKPTCEIYEDVINLLHISELKQVDLAIAHGTFSYQLPKAATKSPKHIEEDYLAIVKHYILIGHVHIHSTYDRILAQGSFDRLAHGEESPKGGIQFTIRRDGSREYHFIENKLAKKFITILIKKDDIDTNVAIITKATKSLPPDSFVRIKANRDNSIMIAFDEIRAKFPNFRMTKLCIEDEIEDENDSLLSEHDVKTYESVRIDKTNISSMVMEIVDGKYNLSNNVRTSILNELKLVC